jgi:hypothetical protein
LARARIALRISPISLLAVPRGTSHGIWKFHRSHRQPVSWRSSRNATVLLRVRRSTRWPEMLCRPSKMPATRASLAEAAAVAGACDAWFCGGERGRGGGGCNSAGCHRARDVGSVGRRGGDRGGRLVKALLKVPRILQQRTQIDHRVSVVLSDYGERLTFCGVDGVWCRRSGHRLTVRVCCDAAHDTDTPT